MTGRTVALGFRLARLALLTAACSGDPSGAPAQPSRPPAPVRVETVAAERVAPRLVVPGIVEAKSRIELGFRVSGFVARFGVEEGDRVEAGALCLSIAASDLPPAGRAAPATLAGAGARAAAAELAFGRQRQLFELASTSQKRFDAARLERKMFRAEARGARVELEAAEDRLGKAVLRAPVAGYIERRLVEEHERASAQAPVVVLTELDTVKVRAAVADRDLARLRVGGAAVVRAAAWPEREFRGRLQRIDVAADAATRTVPFEVRVENPELRLRPEMAVEVEVALGAGELVPSVPLAAVLRDLGAEPFAFVVADGGRLPRVERRAVMLGAVHGDRVAVAAGLALGERIVTRGQHFLSDGERVRIVGDGAAGVAAGGSEP